MSTFKIRSLFTVIFTASTLMISPLQNCFAEPNVSSPAYVLMEKETGQVLIGLEENIQREPASTTKVLTALLGLELGSEGEVVVVSDNAARVGEASLHLWPEEEIELHNLILATLMKSGNDGCVAIAEHVAGEEALFVKLMNLKALLLGAKNSDFQNTNGLPDKKHLTTPYDLAVIARYALNNSEFQEMVKSKEEVVVSESPKRKRQLKNTNKLLWNYEKADGVKTGTTNRAGKCLIASASEGDRQLIAVVLKSHDRYGDSKRLLEYGLNNFELHQFYHKGEVIGNSRGEEGSIPLVVKEDLLLSIPKDRMGEVNVTIDYPRKITKPVKKGSVVGKVSVQLPNYSKEVEIVTGIDVLEKKGSWWPF